MKIKVTAQGVTIPKSLLPDVDEVDIRRRNGVIEVRRLMRTPPCLS